MRALVACVVLAAGCGFKPSASSDSRPGGEAGVGSDAGLEVMPGSEPLPFVPPCYAPDTTGLVLCLELEDPGLTAARDGSPAHHDATATMVNVASRDVPATSQAAQIISTSTIQTGTSTDFDLQTFTIMTWVHRENTPAITGKYGLIHALGQYYLAIDDQGRVFCAVTASNGTTFVLPAGTADVVTLNAWDVVACTYDAAQNMCAWHYPGTDGSAGHSTCGGVNKSLKTGITNGIAVGSIAVSGGGFTSHLAGKLDAVRIFNTALDQQHICLAAGLSGC